VPEQRLSTVELRFTTGDPITAWRSFSWQDSFIDPLGSLDVEIHPLPTQRLTTYYRELLAKGGLVHLRIDGAPQCTMLITTYSERIDADGGCEMSAKCKSVLATAYEGDVDPYIAKSFKASTPVSYAVLQALSHYGFEELTANASENLSAMTGKGLSGQAADVLVDALKHEDIQANPGETAYAFCSRIFTRLGVVLRVAWDGKLLITRPDFAQAPAYTLIEGRANSTADANRMLTMSITDTNDGQYSEIVVVGKDADKTGKKQAVAPMVGFKVEGYDRPSSPPFEQVAFTDLPRGRHSYQSLRGASYKPKYVFDKKAADKKRATNMARVMMGARASQAYQLQCTVQGLTARTGRVWTVGTVARVVSGTAGINEPMWILEATKSADAQGGQRTELTLIPLDSLVLGEDG